MGKKSWSREVGPLHTQWLTSSCLAPPSCVKGKVPFRAAGTQTSEENKSGIRTARSAVSKAEQKIGFPHPPVALGAPLTAKNKATGNAVHNARILRIPCRAGLLLWAACCLPGSSPPPPLPPGSAVYGEGKQPKTGDTGMGREARICLLLMIYCKGVLRLRDPMLGTSIRALQRVGPEHQCHDGSSGRACRSAACLDINPLGSRWHQEAAKQRGVSHSRARKSYLWLLP